MDLSLVPLTELERRLREGERGPASAKATELLLALAKVYHAEGMVRVGSVQVSGVSFHNLGDPGLDFLEEWARSSARAARLVATLNPAGMDLERWEEMGVDPGFARKQLRIIAAYEAMGIGSGLTCTPYLAGNLPLLGQHVAWAESSAVTFANSVLGARTNRHGGPAALAAALTGMAPFHGLHLDEARSPDLRVEVTADLFEPFHFGLLGAFIGMEASGALPYIILSAHGNGPKERAPDLACLKALSAALPTFGARPMFHIQGFTPEAHLHQPPEPCLRFGPKELERTSASLNDPVDRVDLVCLGCPHAALDEIIAVSDLMGQRRAKITFWLATSRAVFELARGAGLVGSLEDRGVMVIRDTCFVVAPLSGRFHSVATDSAKGCYYGRGHNRLKVRTLPLEQCVEAALTGRAG